MGSTSSALNTTLGQSIIGKIYKTTVPTELLNNKEYHSSDYWLLNQFEEKKSTYFSMNGPLIQNFGDPHELGDFRIKLPTGLLFKIINVEQETSFNNGTSVKIYVKILDDIKLDNNTPITETISDPDNDKNYIIDSNLSNYVDKTLSSLIDLDSVFHLSGKIIKVSSIFFNTGLVCNFDETLLHKDTLELVV